MSSDLRYAPDDRVLVTTLAGDVIPGVVVSDRRTDDRIPVRVEGETLTLLALRAAVVPDGSDPCPDGGRHTIGWRDGHDVRGDFRLSRCESCGATLGRRYTRRYRLD